MTTETLSLLTLIISSITTIIMGWIGLRMRQLERNTNSKMDQLLTTTGDAKKAEGVTITRDDAPRIIKIFDDRSAKVNAEVDWKPTKNEYCNWCDAKQSQCRFSKKAG